MKKTVYLYDLKTGVYTGTGEIDTTPEGYYKLQPGQSDKAPPACEPGMCARRARIGGWELVAAEELRQAAYKAEADIYRDQALSYQAEAAAWRAGNETDKADAADAKANAALRLYIEKKEEIRARFPGTSAAQ